jgi:hypothetical protein
MTERTFSQRALERLRREASVLKSRAIAHLGRRRPVILLMRYSVLQRRVGGEGWAVRRKSGFENYRAELFDDERLTQRLVALTRIVLPSLAAQTVHLNPRYFRVMVFTSDELPERHLSDLRAALSKYPWATVELVSANEKPDYDRAILDFLKWAKVSPGVIASARLDDDDALCRTYLQRMYRLVTPSNAGKVITFSYGFLGRFDHAKKRFTKFFRVLTPFTAIGLALVSRYDGNALLDGNIFARRGSHLLLRKQPHIEDMSFPAFVRSHYETQDTSGKVTHVLPQPGNKTTRAFVARHVGLARDRRAKPKALKT